MQQAYLDVNGVRTNVLTYGRWVEESPKTSEDHDNIILLITGNPGITGFYKMFAQTLHEQTGYPVWVIGHAGHEVPKNNHIAPIQSWQGHQHLFGLKGQVQHKIDFIRKYVPTSAKLHIVAHSIGAFMALELLHNEEINNHVASVNLLFPAIEHLAQTFNGRFMNRFIRPFVWIIMFVAFIFTCLPAIVQNFLVLAYMRVHGIPKMHFKTIVPLVDPHILYKIFNLAWEELDLIHERNDVILGGNVEKMRLIYGRSDGWNDGGLFDKLKADYPQIKAEMTDFHHSFVLNESRPVALVVANWINNK